MSNLLLNFGAGLGSLLSNLVQGWTSFGPGGSTSGVCQTGMREQGPGVTSGQGGGVRRRSARNMASGSKVGEGQHGSDYESSFDEESESDDDIDFSVAKQAFNETSDSDGGGDGSDDDDPSGPECSQGGNPDSPCTFPSQLPLGEPSQLPLSDPSFSFLPATLLLGGCDSDDNRQDASDAISS